MRRAFTIQLYDRVASPAQDGPHVHWCKHCSAMRLCVGTACVLEFAVYEKSVQLQGKPKTTCLDCDPWGKLSPPEDP